MPRPLKERAGACAFRAEAVKRPHWPRIGCAACQGANDAVAWIKSHATEGKECNERGPAAQTGSRSPLRPALAMEKTQVVVRPHFLSTTGYPVIASLSRNLRAWV
jgi:hypothetical protein